MVSGIGCGLWVSLIKMWKDTLGMKIFACASLATSQQSLNIVFLCSLKSSGKWKHACFNYGSSIPLLITYFKFRFFFRLLKKAICFLCLYTSSNSRDSKKMLGEMK